MPPNKLIKTQWLNPPIIYSPHTVSCCSIILSSAAKHYFFTLFYNMHLIRHLTTNWSFPMKWAGMAAEVLNLFIKIHSVKPCWQHNCNYFKYKSAEVTEIIIETSLTGFKYLGFVSILMLRFEFVNIVFVVSRESSL